jgi:Fur family ferric uptake transcriptional regulator
MDEKAIEKLLLSHGVRPTANRIVIAKALADAPRPMTMRDLEYSILTIDKSGIFRTLVLFRDHHLVHTIEEADNVTGYELCLSHDNDRDEDEHAHFYCEQCHRTFCLTGVAVPMVPLPEGFEARSASYLVHGICAECRQKHHQK